MLTYPIIIWHVEQEVEGEGKGCDKEEVPDEHLYKVLADGDKHIPLQGKVGVEGKLFCVHSGLTIWLNILHLKKNAFLLNLKTLYGSPEIDTSLE